MRIRKFLIVALLEAALIIGIVYGSVNAETESGQGDLIRDELELMTINNSDTQLLVQDETEELHSSNNFTTVLSLIATTVSSPIESSIKNKQPNQLLASMVRTQLKKEIRKLKSSITDSIMEEVINYYGKKLDSIDGVKEKLDSLNGKLSSLTQNLNTLSQNFKGISRNHRNLVDVVRNNLLNKNEDKSAARFRSSKVSAIDSMTSLKKKSIEGNNKTTGASNVDDVNLELLKNKIKAELIKDLEAKYFDMKNSFKPASSVTNNRVVASATTQPNLTAKETYDIAEYSIFLKNKPIPSDCQDLKNEGIVQNDIYEVIVAKANKSVYVYCEFEDNFGWTVLQRRFDGSVSFNQNWNAYKNGFGNLDKSGEFWLGLENIYLLTSQNLNYSLQIEMIDWKEEVYIAEYEYFRVDDEKNKYKLMLGGYRKSVSNAGDSFGDELSAEQSHNGMSFSTYDNDNDMRFYDNCAQLFKSGWWFNQCFNSNLNGIYYHYSNVNTKKRSENSSIKSAKFARHEENTQLRFLRNGIHWNTIDFYKSLKSTKLRVRRRD